MSWATGSVEQQRLIREGDAILRAPGRHASEADFDSGGLVLFIHGFTADASYLSKMMVAFEENGLKAFAFNYACYDGIDRSARSLGELLESFDTEGHISCNRMTVVAHSMGGLVARALLAFERGSRYVSKLVTLGTPHDATLRDAALFIKILQAGEYTSKLNPRAYAPTSLSRQQLMGQDPTPTLIDRLKEAFEGRDSVRYLSISGGRPELELGKNAILNKTLNVALQASLDKPNDGLVAETSSDLSARQFTECAPGCHHVNDYAAYWDVNHTYLVQQQILFRKAIAFARLE